MKIHPRLASIKPSATLALNAKAKAMTAAGEDVISLAAGEPDFAPPESILDAARKALQEGRTRYTPAPGLPELRAEIAEHMTHRGVACEASQVVVSTGGKQALHNIFQALLSAGDEVLLPAPCWVSYPALIELTGATPVILPPTDTGIFSPEQLEAACTPKTRAVIINSPNNPSGQVISAEEMSALERLACERDLIVISDELYADLVYDGVRHVSPASRPALADRTVIVGGFSKSYALTGWRLGWSVTPTDVAAAISAFQSHTTSNPNSLAQYAVLGALAGACDDVERMRQAFDRRRRLVVDGLSALEGVSCPEPHGAFYAFPDVRAWMDRAGFDDDVALSTWLLETHKLAVVPGMAFAAPGRVRLSYAASDETLREALERLKKAIG